ncbi:outer membrane protein assembly factor BamA [Thiomicrorhabdus sediminis]|nr:outer membrane protein assembly factor BamA [Thiomicrorhabdus sediminis]
MSQQTFKNKVLSAAITSILFTPAIANAFTVNQIKVEGAKKIGQETVTSYLNVNKGSDLDAQAIQDSIQRLYKTGFFQDVALFEGANGTLIVKVVERPSIAEITFEGNELIETEALTTALDTIGLKKGRVYNNAQLDQVIVDLKRRYQNQGYYAASIDIQTSEMDRDRVAIKVVINEGEPATIGRINLVGNNIYSDDRLKAKMQMEEGGDDKYSKPKMEADIETIKSFYMDNGYADFKVRSSQVSISADQTKVFTTINMTEGAQFKIDQVDYIGELIIGRDEVEQLVDVKAGDIFSRSKIIDAVNKIRDRLSEEGYAFAEVAPETLIDRENNTISLNFKVEPKKRVYIRRIEIEGNTRTRDHVIRREMRQMESAPYSLKSVRQSKERIQRLGFFLTSDVQTERVSEDQVDLIVKVEEQPTGSFTAGIGYSQVDGASFNVGVSERNFIGSGHQLDFKVASSAARKTADIGVTNPYFTEDGVSLGVGFYYSEIDATELDVADYTTNNLGVRTSLGYPISETDSLNYGLKFDNQDLVCANTFTYCNDYVAQNGKSNSAVLFTMGWNHNSTNAFYFPTEGHKTSLSLEAAIPATTDAPFYKVYASESWFTPISENFTLQLKTGLAFGDGYGELTELPFFERFYAGGIGSVRGFEPNSLGPQFDYATDGSSSPAGGAVKFNGTVGIVSPVPLIEDSSNARITMFFDFGNVYTDFDAVDLAELRAAVGLGVSWITPVGPLTFSLARAVATKEDDQLQNFQFTLGAGF